MSWKAWTVEGYGYPLFNSDNFAKVISYIADEKKDEKLLNCEDEFDVNDLYSVCAAELVADIINEKEGYTVFQGYNSCGETTQEQYIGIGMYYPWSLAGRDARLTKERANKILMKYAELLGIKEAPDYFTAEYCG